MLLTSVGTLGIPYIVKDEEFYFKDGNLTWFYNFRGINNVYLYYWFLSPAAQYLINAKAIGSTQKALTIDTLKKFDILLPPIEVQNQIVSILKSLDDKIEVNRRINENLEQQAQALFKSWFVDFEPFKDQPFVESELGMIPQCWKVGCLDDLCSFISRGLTPKYDETSDELILGQTCVRNNIVTLNNARRHRPKSKTEKWVQQWDVLLNSTGIGSLGRVGVVYFKMDNVAIDSHITVVRTSKPLYKHYVGRNLLSRQLEIENMAVGSTGQTELPRDRVKALPIIIPSGDVLGKFNDIIEPIALQMYRNIDESRRLAELRDTLLPRLMSGELHVNDM
jgi:type I restriction enzyme S subunit